ncbi:CueP family metal-binding protein [Brachybacterium sp. YJGR34]|uniref:CueP family metal-binding protein n=1 Tax=Brachybacterium sp. YJGR34 TaxID=2059911 RepID=UPI001E39D907|nr:CueP family metal-binding protein [Brachybacterium sp. YJGR34]
MSTPAPARRTLLGGLALAPLALLAGCTGASPQEALLRDLGLEGMGAREIIDHLDALPLDERPQGILAAVHPTELVLSDESGREAALPLPEDSFYLSVAPFLRTTHDCHLHSLTTCLGELPEQEISVLVTDDAGEAIVDATVTTQPNGFLGLWLPRGKDLAVTCSADGRSGSVEVSTRGDGAATCLTTLQMTA